MVYPSPETNFWTRLRLGQLLAEILTSSVLCFDLFFSPKSRTSLSSLVQADPFLECFRVRNGITDFSFLVETAAKHLYLDCVLQLNWN